MTRKKFLQDLDRARQNPPAHITNVQHHEDDGLRFTYSYHDNNAPQQSSLVLVNMNVDEYPHANSFIIYANDDNQIDDNHKTHPAILTSLEQIQVIIDGMPISTALEEISSSLHQALTSGRAGNPILLDSDPVYMSAKSPQNIVEPEDWDGQGSDFDDDDDDCDYDSGDNFGFDRPKASQLTLNRKKSIRNILFSDNKRIKQDLRATKDAGFRIGVYGNLELDSGIVCVSVRIAKLGISEEVMQAWDVSKKQYLVLLIRFQQGYRDLFKTVEDRATEGKVKMRVGLCDSYKPGQIEAFDAFNQADTMGGKKISHSGNVSQVEPLRTLEPLFIGRPINDLLRDRFTQIVKFRSWGMSWAGAEHCYNSVQGSADVQIPSDIGKYDKLDAELHTRALPAIVRDDSLGRTEVKNASLPLVAMQFVLRHFVRCTEFCLVCHCQLTDSFEALKPYVCSKPLCLYQFLALGFGPSIEWEIISQPYVVDLLISLCYAQARASRLKELPHGIGLKVPGFKESDFALSSHYPPQPPATPVPIPATVPPQTIESFRGILNHRTNVLILIPDSFDKDTTLRGGEWLAMRGTHFSGTYHHRVRNVIDTQIYLNDVIKTQDTPGGMTAETRESSEVDCYIYDTEFDSLPLSRQQLLINLMLDTLPSAPSMQKQLLAQRTSRCEPSLNLLVNIPPAARDLLRWIVASNRSCIMQVDKVCNDTTIPEEQLRATEPRVSNMDEWLQFRFAQGAPDKEQRFVDSIKQITVAKPSPTIFAWHGSPLYNWHSIIRTGLNFDEVAHGRATGHGVYMSSHLNTSLSYSGLRQIHTGIHLDHWPNSELKISTVVSLQEVVNATDKFVSKSPHFVVAQKEWIQTRYLFVKTNVRYSTGYVPEDKVQQDPAYRLIGAQMELIEIPIHAVSKSRRPAADSPSDSKRAKVSEAQTGDTDDNVMSDSSDDEDCRMIDIVDHHNNDVLESDEDSPMADLQCRELLEIQNKPITAPSSVTTGRKRKSDPVRFLLDPSKTDFIPGSLNTSNIKFLPPPMDATPSGTRALLKAFNETIKVQETTPLHELGFYVDPDRMENMYQWIVELHSFDPTLPLAKDMAAAAIRSVVLEMRFTPEYPYSPPFVRVVKPQFLPFVQGGGGHVTEGGAICMELLTSTGWSVVNTVESVLLQIRLALSETERPARLWAFRGKYSDVTYEMGDAITAFRRACMKHGWTAPQGIDKLL